MRILWFGNSILSDDISTSGSWLPAMARLIRDKVELTYITSSALYDEITVFNYGSVRQYILPRYKLTRTGLPEKNNIIKILNIIEEVDPDIIHIWGMESFPGLLQVNGYLKKFKVLLEVQGVRSSCAEVCYGGLTIGEIIKCIRIKEILKPSTSVIADKRIHIKNLGHEAEMLKAFNYISTQSEWTRARIAPYISNDTQVFCTERSVRREFTESNKWQVPGNDAPVVMTVSAGAYPLKGIHILIRAIGLLRNKYPNICLKIVGDFGAERGFLRKSGYMKFLQGLINTLGLINNVQFTGRLNAKQMVDEMKNSNVFVHSSFVESYCLAAAEAMAVGIPCVFSYAGALPHLADDKKSAFFYSPTDYHTCAHLIEELFVDKAKAVALSDAERDVSEQRNNPERVASIQMSIYSQIINL